jgi:hypothetical protein
MLSVALANALRLSDTWRAAISGSAVMQTSFAGSVQRAAHRNRGHTDWCRAWHHGGALDRRPAVAVCARIGGDRRRGGISGQRVQSGVRLGVMGDRKALKAAFHSTRPPTTGEGRLRSLVAVVREVYPGDHDHGSR